MTKTILLILVTIGLAGCNSYDRTKWETFLGYGISIEDSQFSTLNFLNDSSGYFGGRLSLYQFKEDGTIESQSHVTELYRTLNTGRSWRQVELKEEGGIQKIRFHGNSLYALSQFLGHSPSIYHTSDSSEQFTKIISFPDSCYVRDFGILNSGDLIVALDNKNKLNLLKIGNNFDTLAVFQRFHYNVTIGRDNIYLINPSGGANSNGVIIFDPLTNTQRTEAFGLEGFVTSTYLTRNQEYWVTLNDKEEHGRLLKLTSQGFKEIDLGRYKDYSLNTVCKSGSTILVDANRKEAVGPIGVTHELLTSNDSGATWNLENYPFSLIVKPFDILPNGQYITYQGMGMFQFRK